MFPYQCGGDVAGMGRRTSPCVTSVLNLGNSPRVPIVRVPENNKEQEDAGKTSLPAKCDERDSCPSHRQFMRLLSMTVIPEERSAFWKRFWKASDGQDGRCCDFLGQSPITVIAKAFGCEPFQLRAAADMFPGSQTESEFLIKFYIMDVIMNQASLPAVTGGNKRGRRIMANLLKLPMM